MKESSRLLFLAFIMLTLIFSAVYYSKQSNEDNNRYEASFSFDESDNAWGK